MRNGSPLIFGQPPKTTQQYVLWLMKIGHLITKKLNRSLVEEHGVTFHQVRILFFIKHVAQKNPEKMTLAHLADSLLLTLPNVNGLIMRLQKDGYLRKQRSARDKRSHYLQLQPKGRRLLRHLHAHWPPKELRQLDAFFTTLSPRQQQEFSRTLGKIAEYLWEC